MAVWKRSEPEPQERVQPAQPGPAAAAPAPDGGAVGREPAAQKTGRSSVPERKVVAGIGRTIRIKGELSGNEDLTVEGRIEGKIKLDETLLTVGEHGEVNAEIAARTVVVLGKVEGNIKAAEKVDIRDQGRVDGDICSPRVAIAEGAHFRGSIDMSEAQSAKPAPAPPVPAVKAQDEPRVRPAVKPEPVAKPGSAPPPAAPAGPAAPGAPAVRP